MRAGAAVLALATLASAVHADPPDPRRILHLMHYVAKDYAEAAREKEADELAEQRGFLKEATRQLRALPETPGRAAIATGLERALELVSKTAPADEVAARLEEVAAGLTRAYPADLVVPPRTSLDAGKALYAKACATCHGATGRADGPAVAEMKPRPIQFTDEKKMSELSPALVHDTIAYGVTGTPMPAFESVLSPQDRWDIAFYVFTLRTEKPAPQHLPARVLPLRELALMTDSQLEDLLKNQGVHRDHVPHARKALRERVAYGGTAATR